MYLKQSRILSTKKLLSDVEQNQKFYLGVKLTDSNLEIIKNKLDILTLHEGLIIFPTPFNGAMSRKNAVGEMIPQKDKPKETAYRAQTWEIKDWGGYQHSGTSYVSYKRYPQLFIEPKEFKYIITEDGNGGLICILKKAFIYDEATNDDILFGANLTLEIFNEIYTFVITPNNNYIATKDLETVNWEILPKGEQIWNCFNSKATEKLTNSEQILIKERFDYINSFNPDIIRQGIGGYTGYLIFEFKEKNLWQIASPS